MKGSHRTDRTTAPIEPMSFASDLHDIIQVRGARENNPKDGSLEMPKRKLNVFTGVFRSGESSLVSGTVAADQNG